MRAGERRDVPVWLNLDKIVAHSPLLQQASARVIAEQVGVADVALQDVHRLVPAHVAHFEHAAPRRAALVKKPARRLWAPKAAASRPTLAA
jgi:hypothetical protein